VSNPNNCEACDHKTMNNDGGHCYMFKDAPAEVCLKHSARRALGFELLMAVAKFGPEVPTKEQ
jgi:hypothetical protein